MVNTVWRCSTAPLLWSVYSSSFKTSPLSSYDKRLPSPSSPSPSPRSSGFPWTLCSPHEPHVSPLSCVSPPTHRADQYLAASTEHHRHFDFLHLVSEKLSARDNIVMYISCSCLTLFCYQVSVALRMFEKQTVSVARRFILLEITDILKVIQAVFNWFWNRLNLSLKTRSQNTVWS